MGVQMPTVLSCQNNVRASHVQQTCNVFQFRPLEGTMHASVQQANSENVQVRKKESKQNI